MKLTYYRQPTANSCGHTAVAMLLSGFGITKSPLEVIENVGVQKRPGTDELWGSLLTDQAMYLMSLGLKTKVISFDCQVTDMSWRGKDKAFLLERLQAIKNDLAVPSLGKEGTYIYVAGYLAYLQAGGELQIAQHPTVSMLTGALKHGPFIASVNYQTLYGVQKIRFLPDGLTTKDDDAGIATNHSVVISDYKDGTFEVYDPWNKQQILWVPELDVLMGIMAAQIECDNQLLLVQKA